MKGFIILKGTEPHNINEVIVCDSFAQVWGLQFYRPSDGDEMTKLKTWCKVKGYSYQIAEYTNELPLIINLTSVTNS